MIAKHIPMRSSNKSDFSGLVRYLTDTQSKEHRLGQVRLTNCDADSIRDAICEILATQQTNTRAKGDKTYHLIISFRAGEQVNSDVLSKIEERICESLGFGEHQRISAVHNDTDNLHVHVAINKIHPSRHTIHEPYYSHRTLAEQCERLEKAFGLQQDNHIPNQNRSAARAADMERHSGIESLIGWIKRECINEIKAAQTWSDLHATLSQNGLTLSEKGNGLVISSDTGVTIKASTLDRNLSKPKLESRFGAFKPRQTINNTSSSKRTYQKKPVQTRIDTTELYARYQKEQKSLATDKATALEKVRQKKNQQVLYAKKQGKVRRMAIKLTNSGKFTKRLLYTQASQSLQKSIALVQQQYQLDRQAIYKTYSKRTWADWLKHQAHQGDQGALAALRSREAAQTLDGNTLQGNGKAQKDLSSVIDSITKTGTILFRSKNGAIRDDGKRLQVSGQTDKESIVQALKIAMARYGNQISVNGSPKFKAYVIRAAVDTRLPITFSDKALEQRRLSLLSSNQDVTKNNQRRDISPIGKAPPIIRRNKLSNLSQLAVLSFEKPQVQEHSAYKQRKARLVAEMAKKQEKQSRKSRSR
ncbi:relaxase/mobilization nuclease domain-containing protein [Vibrio alginolyticus]|uniref:TraI/MobA(P) family conjugative relaxase n=1 Tax=Vibrio alginolyticus TaxID=663 RepID=UPI001EEB4DC4|nr:TraI/MobA(P) family conjugative relaxase [Vibrio alginolyticus]MCG6316664.1 relaxase/mobilization nuclease domain-containing protein [Vibrio alginolyticus]